MKGLGRQIWRVAVLLVAAVLALQLYFLARVALMRFVDPESTTFQRSEAWRLRSVENAPAWRHDWVGYDRISANLKRAVIASEDSGFVEHDGVEWDALEKAWDRNQKTEARAARINQAIEQRVPAPAAATKGPAKTVVPKVVGGSTITQQLAKNLFLDGERTLLRKGQEFVITFMLEALLPKQRILEIYLNSVEWGEGVFGAEAAAERYFHVPAARLGVTQAAQLAVMLPAPKRFEKRPNSPYVVGRAGTIAARMSAVDLP
jgi:monofunctional biosynthetic peptidoglycan transglycosylase